MKHVLVASTLYPNAVNPRFGTFVARSIEALAKRGDWKVSVVSPIGLPPLALGRYRPLAELPEVSSEGAITVYRPRFTLIPKVGARLNAAAIARAVLPLARRIHAEAPVDLVDAQFFFPDGPAAAEVAAALGVPLSIKARGSDISFWGDYDFARRQMLAAAKAATGLLAVSRDLAGQMAAMGMDAAKITVHYTGLDRDRFRPFDHPQLRRQLSEELGFDLPNNAPLLACVGALIERKGQDIAIQSLKAIPGARLVLIGKGDDEGRLRTLAASAGAADRVFFAGSIDHDVMPLILSAADVMVLPTASEGLANAWVEALACGTPVVTSDVGGARELINSPIAGRLVPRDAGAVADAINAILNDPPPREAVAALTEGFSWDANAAALAEHYERLVSGA